MHDDFPSFEPFVDAEKAARFISVKPRYLLDLARKGHMPAHPLGAGKRRVWRFRLSELAAALGNPAPDAAVVYDPEETRYGTGLPTRSRGANI
jgi:hypothetical protein